MFQLNLQVQSCTPVYPRTRSKYILVRTVHILMLHEYGKQMKRNYTRTTLIGRDKKILSVSERHKACPRKVKGMSKILCRRARWITLRILIGPVVPQGFLVPEHPTPIPSNEMNVWNVCSRPLHTLHRWGPSGFFSSNFFWFNTLPAPASRDKILVRLD